MNYIFWSTTASVLCISSIRMKSAEKKVKYWSETCHKNMVVKVCTVTDDVNIAQIADNLRKPLPQSSGYIHADVDPVF